MQIKDRAVRPRRSRRLMRKKRNPVKQIMSDVHRDVRSGRVKLGGHDGFVAEVRRRVAAAGLREDDLTDLTAKRRSHDADETEPER